MIMMMNWNACGPEAPEDQGAPPEDRTLPRAGLTHLSGDPAYPQPVRLPLIGPLQEPAYGTIMMMNIILMRSLARRNMEGGTGGRWILTLPTAAGDMKMMSTVTWMMSFMMHLRAESETAGTGTTGQEIPGREDRPVPLPKPIRRTREEGLPAALPPRHKNNHGKHLNPPNPDSGPVTRMRMTFMQTATEGTETPPGVQVRDRWQKDVKRKAGRESCSYCLQQSLAMEHGFSSTDPQGFGMWLYLAWTAGTAIQKTPWRTCR